MVTVSMRLVSLSKFLNMTSWCYVATLHTVVVFRMQSFNLVLLSNNASLGDNNIFIEFNMINNIIMIIHVSTVPRCSVTQGPSGPRAH